MQIVFQIAMIEADYRDDVFKEGSMVVNSVVFARHFDEEYG
jgi:hypothetical protein